MASDTLTMTAATPRAIGDARHALEAQLDRWACGRMPDSLLVFSELVTNAVTHAGGAIRIVVEHGDHTLRLAVHDDTHGVPALRDAASAEGGFGLRIVDRVSASWGWEQTASGKVVWSALDCCVDNVD
jgi:anti-sigma regulatory factor (Ser/Thr protein kinase)